MSFLKRMRGIKAELVFGSFTIDLKHEKMLLGRNADGSFNELQIYARTQGSSIVISKHVGTVSRNHALLEWNDTQKEYTITDLSSTYGTKVNGKKIIPGKKVVLVNEDTVELGSWLRFTILYT